MSCDYTRPGVQPWWFTDRIVWLDREPGLLIQEHTHDH